MGASQDLSNRITDASQNFSNRITEASVELSNDITESSVELSEVTESVFTDAVESMSLVGNIAKSMSEEQSGDNSHSVDELFALYGDPSASIKYDTETDEDFDFMRFRRPRRRCK